MHGLVHLFCSVSILTQLSSLNFALKSQGS
jgi:hypothetical protein